MGVCALVLLRTGLKPQHCCLVLGLMLPQASGVAALDQLSPTLIIALTQKAKSAGGCEGWEGR